MSSPIDGFLNRVGPIVGGVIAGAFGDSIVIGALIGLMDHITPMQCYHFIQEDKELLPVSLISDEDWIKVRQFVRKARLDKLDNERIIKAFQKNRPDLLSVVINQPGGVQWLGRELDRMRSKLGIS